LEHIIILLIRWCRAVGGFGGEALAVGRCRILPSINGRGGVIAPVLVWHVGAAAEEDGWIVVVSRCEGEHGNSARGWVNTNYATGHIWKRSFSVGVKVPEDCKTNS
jgi:hypothetical protein